MRALLSVRTLLQRVGNENALWLCRGLAFVIFFLNVEDGKICLIDLVVDSRLSLDVLYAIHQLTITFITYIFKITSLTFLFFRRARKKSFL